MFLDTFLVVVFIHFIIFLYLFLFTFNLLQVFGNLKSTCVVTFKHYSFLKISAKKTQTFLCMESAENRMEMIFNKQQTTNTAIFYGIR